MRAAELEWRWSAGVGRRATGAESPRGRRGGEPRRSDEVPVLERLSSVLKPLIDDLGNAADERYVNDPRWDGVVAFADQALPTLNARRQ